MICLIKYFCWKKRVVSLWLFGFIWAVKWSLGIANAALLICPRQLYSFFRHTSFFVFPILYLSIEIDQNRSKSIKINHNRTKSIITRNCVIDFYPFPIFVDWFVSTMIDNNRILSTIGIIDMLRPDDKLTLQAEYISLRKCSIVIKVIYL